MDPNFFIETPRLYISHWQPDSTAHCEFLVQLLNTPTYQANIGNSNINTLAQARDMLQDRIDRYHKPHGYGNYLISLKLPPVPVVPRIPDSTSVPYSNSTTTETSASFADPTTYRPIGAVSLLKRPEYSAPDLGYAIAEGEGGKGYATEAARALAEYARTTLGVHHVVGFFNPQNPASGRVLEKCGLEYRGERNLKAFNSRASVMAMPGMGDLTLYGIEDDSD